MVSLIFRTAMRPSLTGIRQAHAASRHSSFSRSNLDLEKNNSVNVFLAIQIADLNKSIDFNNQYSIDYENIHSVYWVMANNNLASAKRQKNDGRIQARSATRDND